MKSSRFLFIAGIIGLMSMASCSDSRRVDPPSASLVQNQSAIVNGQFDLHGYYDGVVSIIITNHPQYAEQIVCTGTLISPRHVLTAAHCVANQSNYYMLLSEDSSNPDCKWKGAYLSAGAKPLLKYMKVNGARLLNSKYRYVFDIERVYYHSDYASILQSTKCYGEHYLGYEVTNGDIAIIELTSDVPEIVAKPAIVLPPWLGMTQDKVDAGLNVTFGGYGFDENGQKGKRKFVSGKVSKYCGPDDDEICPVGETVHVAGCHPNSASCAKYGELNYKDDYVAMPRGAFLYLQPDGGPCNGDSGGPAFLNVGGRQYLAGITSYGDIACRSYGVSTAVQDYYDWITDIVPSVADKSNYTERCSNGVDDDNDGKVDHDDPDCKDEPFCGDGVVAGIEFCDGDNFRLDTDGRPMTLCSDWSMAYESGTVTCNDICEVDFDNCVEIEVPDTCGNGQYDEGEQCDAGKFKSSDGEVADSDSCAEFSSYFMSGHLKCSEDCTIETENCSVSEEFAGLSTCGDGIVDDTEICDTNIFAEGMATDCSAWNPIYTDGKVKCDLNCDIDMSNCVEKQRCGDFIRSGDEECDGNDFEMNITTCNGWSERFSEGSVKCNDNCTIDFSECSLIEQAQNICGNGKIDSLEVDGAFFGAEECDGDAFVNGNKCTDWSDLYVDGEVHCLDNCTVSFDSCVLASGDIFVSDDSTMTNALKNKSKPENKAPKKENTTVTFSPNDDNLQEPWVAEFKASLNGQGGGSGGSGGSSTGNNEKDGGSGGCSMASGRGKQPVGMMLLALPLVAAAIRRRRS